MLTDHRDDKSNDAAQDLFHMAPYVIILVTSIIMILVHMLLPEHITLTDAVFMVGTFVLGLFLLMIRLFWVLLRRVDRLLRSPDLQQLEKRKRDLEITMSESLQMSQLLTFHGLIAVEASVPSNSEIWILTPNFDDDLAPEFLRIVKENVEMKGVIYRYFIHPNAKGDYERFRKKLRVGPEFDRRIHVYHTKCFDDLIIWETSIYNATSEARRVAYVGAFGEACYAQRINEAKTASLFRELNKYSDVTEGNRCHTLLRS